MEPFKCVMIFSQSKKDTTYKFEHSIVWFARFIDNMWRTLLFLWVNFLALVTINSKYVPIFNCYHISNEIITFDLKCVVVVLLYGLVKI